MAPFCQASPKGCLRSDTDTEYFINPRRAIQFYSQPVQETEIQYDRGKKNNSTANIHNQASSQQ